MGLVAVGLIIILSNRGNHDAMESPPTMHLVGVRAVAFSTMPVDPWASIGRSDALAVVALSDPTPSERATQRIEIRNVVHDDLAPNGTSGTLQLGASCHGSANVTIHTLHDPYVPLDTETDPGVIASTLQLTSVGSTTGLTVPFFSPGSPRTIACTINGEALSLNFSEVPLATPWYLTAFIVDCTSALPVER